MMESPPPSKQCDFSKLVRYYVNRFLLIKTSYHHQHILLTTQHVRRQSIWSQRSPPPSPSQRQTTSCSPPSPHALDRLQRRLWSTYAFRQSIRDLHVASKRYDRAQDYDSRCNHEQNHCSPKDDADGGRYHCAECFSDFSPLSIDG
jgi:hypothetical protein